MGTVTVKGGGLTATAKYTIGSTPPPPSKLLVGGTLRGTDKSNVLTAPRPAWNITRCYNQGEALAVKRPSTIAVSYNQEVQPGWGGRPADVANLKSKMTALPDIPGVRVTPKHEFDNPTKYGTDFKTYLADEVVFSKTVRDINTTRKNPLIIYRCCMAYALTPAGKSRNIRAFYDSGDYDEVGCDVYSINQIGLSVDFAASLGKPLCVPEMGPLDAVPQNDTAMLSYAKQGIAAYRAAGATWVAWFDKNGSGADLDQYTNTRAFWAAQVA